MWKLPSVRWGSAGRALGGSLLLIASLVGQACPLVVDINAIRIPSTSNVEPGRRAAGGNRQVDGFLRCGGDYYFAATSLAHGREIWRTDGTPAGTRLAFDLWPGPSGSMPHELHRFDLGNGPRLVFRANSPSGAGVFVSDGTPAGTFRLPGIQGPSFGFTPWIFEQVGARIVFAGDDGTHGIEPWVSDLTPQGTRMLRDIRPGASSRPTAFFTIPGTTTCLFAASDNQQTELWVTDGTPGGTRLLADINPGGSSSPNFFVHHNGTTLFRAGDRDGQELWRTDGTTAGTVRVKDIDPGGPSSRPGLSSAVAIGTNLYFTANTAAHGTELWRTDGTTAGTNLVVDIEPGSTSGAPLPLHADSGKLWFGAFRRGFGAEPMVFDPATGRLSSLGDLIPNFRGSAPRDWVGLGNGHNLFSAEHPTAGRELWITDGTAAGTQLLADIEPGPLPSTPAYTTRLGNRIVFAATEATTGRELWITDGTAAGTQLLADPEPAFQTRGSLPYWSQSTAFDGELMLFEADDGRHGRELHALRDGQSELVLDIRPGTASSNPRDFAALFDGQRTQFVFRAEDDTAGAELWITDGSAAGTRRLADLRPGRANSSPQHMTRAGNRVFFAADDGINGRELWLTDGSTAGTRMVTNLAPGNAASSPAWLTPLGDGLVFSAQTGRGNFELWYTDGTAPGTRTIDLDPQSSSRPANFRPFAGGLAFSATTASHGRELWFTDGTTAGTRRWTDIASGRASADPELLVAMGNQLFFRADDGTTGEELWVTDGTLTGTRLVRDIAPGSADSSPVELAASGARLYFSAQSPTGRELWLTDGTAARQVIDLVPGTGSSNPRFLVAAGGGGVYFVASTPALGSELWFSDGTAAGTNLVCESLPGPDSTNPRQLALIDSDLVFVGDSAQLGIEVHRIPTPGRARVLEYSAGCRAGRIGATDPVLGASAMIRGNGWDTRLGAALAGLPPTTSPIALPLSAGCAFHLAPGVLVPIATFTTTSWASALPVPADTTLLGKTTVLQAFDGNGRELRASNAVRLVIGR